MLVCSPKGTPLKQHRDLHLALPQRASATLRKVWNRISLWAALPLVTFNMKEALPHWKWHC